MRPDPTRLLAPLVRALPVPLAVRAIAWLASRGPRLAPTPEQSAALVRGRRLVTPEAPVAWTWGDVGPVVLLVHGWGGSAAQMAPLAERLAARGLRCFAIDVAGHGESPVRRASWDAFVGDVATAARRHAAGAPFAVVGHSAGALGAMAARLVHGLRAQRWVCVCAPSHPFPPIRAVRQRLAPPERVLDGYRAHIAAAFRTHWTALENGAAFSDPPEHLLLVHDPRDRFVDPVDAARLRGWCAEARTLQTSGHGHARVLASNELAEAVAGFLQLTEVPA